MVVRPRRAASGSTGEYAGREDQRAPARAGCYKPALMYQHGPPLPFDNTFLRELPADPVEANRTRQVFGACYSHVAPTPVAMPRLVATAREVAALIGLHEADCTTSAF